MSKITLSSLNVRGLANNEKRRELFYWLKTTALTLHFLALYIIFPWCAIFGVTYFFLALNSNSVSVSGASFSFVFISSVMFSRTVVKKVHVNCRM